MHIYALYYLGIEILCEEIIHKLSLSQLSFLQKIQNFLQSSSLPLPFDTFSSVLLNHSFVAHATAFDIPIVIDRE